MINNADRILNAAEALHTYQVKTKCDHEDKLSDLLADLMHWAANQKEDFDEKLKTAKAYYNEER